MLFRSQDPPPAIESLRPDVPKRFGTILMRLMAKEPGDRYQHPADLVRELVALAADLGLDVTAPRTTMAATVVEPPAGPAPVHLPWLVPLFGLVAVVGGLWLRSGGLEARDSQHLLPADRGGWPRTTAAADARRVRVTLVHRTTAATLSVRTSRRPGNQALPPRRRIRLTLHKGCRQVKEPVAHGNLFFSRGLRPFVRLTFASFEGLNGRPKRLSKGTPQRHRMSRIPPSLRDLYSRTVGHDRYQRKTIPVAVRTTRGTSWLRMHQRKKLRR